MCILFILIAAGIFSGSVVHNVMPTVRAFDNGINNRVINRGLVCVHDAIPDDVIIKEAADILLIDAGDDFRPDIAANCLINATTGILFEFLRKPVPRTPSPRRGFPPMKVSSHSTMPLKELSERGFPVHRVAKAMHHKPSPLAGF